MLSGLSVGIVQGLSKHTSRRWSNGGVRIRSLYIKRTKTIWVGRRRGAFFFFPYWWGWSLIIFWPGVQVDRGTHHEHLWTWGSRWLRLVYHLCLLRWKWLFQDSWGPFEQATSFGLSWTILSIVIFLTNEARILRLLLWSIKSRWLGGPCFGASALPLPFPFFL